MNPTPSVLGIFGDPIGHSLSPLMHTTAACYHSLNYVYLPFWVKTGQLPAATAGMRALGIKGINVTIPHKQAIMRLVDEVTPEAQLIGALNTIVNREGVLIGYNTDGPGFIASLRQDAGEDPQGKRVLLLGAGGAARAIAIHLILEGIEGLTIANRTPEKARQLASYIREKLDFSSQVFSLESEEINPLLPQVDMIINSTSVGMHPGDPSLFDYRRIEAHHLICDIVYRPLETPLLLAARERGAKILDGLGMLIRQGALAFDIWTSFPMPVELVRQKLLQELTTP